MTELSDEKPMIAARHKSGLVAIVPEAEIAALSLDEWDIEPKLDVRAELNKQPERDRS